MYDNFLSNMYDKLMNTKRNDWLQSPQLHLRIKFLNYECDEMR